MRFRFVWVGKTRSKGCSLLQDEYYERLAHFAKCEITEVREAEGGDAKEIEGKRILDKLNPTSLVCLLDVTGRGISSHGLAAAVEKWQNTAVKEVAFVIGGANGVSQAVAERADDRISLSLLTFTHDFARAVLLEQLYRAFTIIKGYPYQK
jgi:23S rRNA (pseudouridine1915-N3)-methyltransferase